MKQLKFDITNNNKKKRIILETKKTKEKNGKS